MPSHSSSKQSSLSKRVALQFLAVANACLTFGLSDAAVLPTAPQTFDASYAAQTGNTIKVAAGGDFQAALNSAQLGDTIVLQADATYRGFFTLPNKTTGTGWIYVVSSNYASLPGPGQRVGPSDAANMPKIVAPDSNGALTTVANSHHFRFVGIELTSAAGVYVYSMVTIGNGDTSTATLPNHIVFDRCYVHADPTSGGRRGILMNGAYVAAIDSYISDFKEAGADTQALGAYNGSGPFKIVDNYLEAAGENVMFGGADSAAASLVPSDIEITNNYFFKPLSLIGTPYTVKNLLELKAAQRVLISGNTFENSPAGAQSGFAFLITPRNQNGTAPWTVTSDIALVSNTFINAGSGLNIMGQDTNPPTLETVRVLVRNNLIGVTGLAGADGRAIQIIDGGSDYTIDHNTIINTATQPATCCSVLLIADKNGGTPTANFAFTNNLSTATTYGVMGNGVGSGTNAINTEFTNWVFSKNAIVGAQAGDYPSGNFFPASVAVVGFTNYAGGDYTLAAGSPYKNAGTDGLDLGANLSSAGIATSATVAPPNPPTNILVQ